VFGGAFDQTLVASRGEAISHRIYLTTNGIPHLQAMLTMIKLAPCPDHKFPSNHACPQFGDHAVLSGQRQGVLELVFSHARVGHSSLLASPHNLGFGYHSLRFVNLVAAIACPDSGFSYPSPPHTLRFNFRGAHNSNQLKLTPALCKPCKP
jgi:hypothetical protein